MTRSLSLDEIIANEARRMASELLTAAGAAANEEELKIACEKQLASVQAAAGISLTPHHEFTVASGRVDSVYDCVIIEYKNPRSAADRIGADAASPGFAKVVHQIKRRFQDMAQELGHPLNRLFGVGLDGNHYVFVRFRESRWHVQNPIPVDRFSTERFLWALFNLGQKGKPFSPDYLADDFGADSPVAVAGVKAFYDAITRTDNPRAAIFYNQWKILFGEVCGYDVEEPSERITKLANSYEIASKGLKPPKLLFAIHSYYALFMKLLAAEIVAFFHKLPTPLERMLQAGTSGRLKRELEELEAGGIFRHLNITNFLEGDLFAWYTSAWSEPVEAAVRQVIGRADDYNPGTLSEDPSNSRDLLKKLYQQLFPRAVRHDLGEYYTPDWLAEHVLNEAGYIGEPQIRVLDPACGSGTFLVMAINRIRAWYDANRERCPLQEGGLCGAILGNIIGFDLNPLAVMASRTNYLIAIRDLISHIGRVEIPVYLCDSILTPSEYGGLFSGRLGLAKELKTAATTFFIPSEIASSREDIATYAETLEFCVKNQFSSSEFLDRCKDDGLAVEASDLHTELYDELVLLDKENRNGVWARIIKNAFAPLFIGRVDLVVGNPPWINWESLPDEYRDTLKPLWQDYGLFTLSGSAGRLGGGKKDLAMLFVYACADNYLTEGGSLAFVITQSIFKSKGAGDGFRQLRFSRNQSTTTLRPIIVHDLSDILIFEGAVNRTAVFVCSKETEDFEFPIKYVVWQGITRIDQSTPLDEVLGSTQRIEMRAVPKDANRRSSPWLTAPNEVLPIIQKASGSNAYKGIEGVNTGGLNGCFWIEVRRRQPNGNLLIENLAAVGKNKLDEVQAVIEPDLVHPLLRGRDLQRWHAAPSAHIIVAQDPYLGKGISEPEMKKKLPRSYAYLKRLEGDPAKPARGTLRGRALFKLYFRPTDPFYSMYNVGADTFAPWKVVYKRLSNAFQAAVVGQAVVPHEKVILIPAASEDEAHYVCGVLNSSVPNLLLRASAVRVQTIEYAPSDIAQVALPNFEAQNLCHCEIVDISQSCHRAADQGNWLAIPELEERLDRSAARLWGITAAQLHSVQEALLELHAGTKMSDEPANQDD